MSDTTKKRKIRSFRQSWLTQFNWLTYDDGKNAMFCSLCIKHKKNNAFTSQMGCTDFQHSSLTRHVQGKCHELAVIASKQQLVFKKAVTNAHSKTSDGLIAQLKTVMYLVQQGLALDKFTSLLELQ